MVSSSQMTDAYATWQRGVAGVLARARKADAGTLPPDPERLLTETTYDGLEIAPLYTALDELPELPLPGAFPFARGAGREVTRGWLVSEYIAQPAGAAANEQLLSALENGVSALWLGAGPRGVPAAELRAALAGVLLDLAPLTLDAGPGAAAAAAGLWQVLDDYDCADRSAIVAGLGAAPLTSQFGGAADVSLAEAVSLAGAAAGRPETVSAIVVDGTVFHNAGAADAQELGAAVAAGLEYLRALTGAGLPVHEALGQIGFRFAATDDQFASTAKFRAARLMWARVAQVCGAPDFGAAHQHAVTSAAMMSQRDPWVNMLRTTLAAFGAGTGGADMVTVLPFDSALPPQARTVSAGFAARMARNTQLLLLEEAHVGRVADPAAGSWYAEQLTSMLAARAWEFTQELEAAGGYAAALSAGLLTARIAATRAQRDSDVAHRKTTVTGVNEFPNLAEPPLPAAPGPAAVARYGAAFEALRDRSDAWLVTHGRRPPALLVPLGPVAEHNARVSFAANLLASGGISPHNPGSVGVGGIARAVGETGAVIAVLCGSDTRYGTDGAAAVAQLRAAGVTTVLLAGPRESLPDGPDGYLTMNIDAAAVLAGLLDKLGA